jgi:hypothetical protein
MRLSEDRLKLLHAPAKLYSGCTTHVAARDAVILDRVLEYAVCGAYMYIVVCMFISVNSF